MAQLINITSEALQATIRRLLPSQQGFGEDLQATNLITPIIDLTPTAEGSQLPQFIQQALAFGSQTAFNVNNATATLISTPGFFRITGIISCVGAGGFVGGTISLSDGFSTKGIYGFALAGGATGAATTENVDFTVFLRAGDTCSVGTDANTVFIGSTRQVATVTGELVNPAGFSSE